MKSLRLAAAIGCTPLASAQFAELSQFNVSSPALTSVLAADVDLDGDSDAVVIDRGGRRLRWFESTVSGPSSVARPIAIESDAFEVPVATDLDGDGDVDLVGFVGDAIAWYENLGGAFASWQSIATGLIRAEELVVADLDGDGAQDVLVLNDDFSAARILWLRGLGGGALAPPVSLLVTPSSIGGLAVEDMDADGDLDVLYGDWLSRNVRCLRNDSALPATVEVILVGVPSGLLRGFAAGDINGDGLPDLVLGSDQEEFTSLNFSTLIFGTPAALPGFQPTQEQRLVDLDGDGDLDLLTRTPTIIGITARRNTAGSLGSPEEVRRLAGVSSLGDISGSGDVDLLVATFDDEVEWLRNSTSGAWPFQAPALPITDPIVEAGATAAGDFDGNGEVDLVVVNDAAGQVLLFRRDPTGAVTRDVIAIQSAYRFATVVAGDFDGDGLLDLALRTAMRRLRVLRGDGAGGFAPPVEFDYTATFSIAAVEAAVDRDGDGDLDLLVRGTSGSAAWMDGDGAGSFAAPVIVWPGSTAATNLFTADLNADGEPDIIRSSTTTIRLEVRLGVAGGALGSVAEVFGSRQGERFALGDLDLDGDLDLVQTSGPGPSGIKTFEFTNGALTFRATLTAPGRLFEDVHLVDSDADGDLDVLGAARTLDGTTHELLLFPQQAPWVIGAPIPLPSTIPNVSEVEVVDIDQDGDQDLLWASPAYQGAGEIRNLTYGEIGAPYCLPAAPNSTGLQGSIRALGSNVAQRNALTLSATHLPPNTFGIFAGSQTQSAPTPVAGSAGLLCLGGSIVRFVRPGQIVNSGTSGQFAIQVDLTDMPNPAGPITAGQTWNFQAWHRDSVMGAATSNLTTAISISWN